MASPRFKYVFNDVRKGLGTQTIAMSDDVQSSPSGMVINDLVGSLTPGAKAHRRPDIPPSKAVMRKVDLSEPSTSNGI